MYEPVAAATADVGVGAVESLSAVDVIEDLYRQVVPKAKALAFHLCGDHYLAEDVVHEAFLKVAAKRSNLRDPNAMQSYMYRAVVNEMRSAGRSNARRDARQENYSHSAASAPYTGGISKIDVDMQRALEQLDAKFRAVVVMAYYLDYTDEQIAETLRRPLGTVRSQRRRALEKLREVLEVTR